MVHSLKEEQFIWTIPVSKKKLINVHSVYMGHDTYCTVRVGHALGTAEVAEGPLLPSGLLTFNNLYLIVKLLS
jgi:hypothetical protein